MHGQSDPRPAIAEARRPDAGPAPATTALWRSLAVSLPVVAFTFALPRHPMVLPGLLGLGAFAAVVAGGLLFMVRARPRDLHRQEIEARFRSLVQNASDVILVAQAGGRLRSETPSVEPVLGYRPDEVAALTLPDLIHPDDAAATTALLHATLSRHRSAPTRAEWRVRHADGHWLDMEVIANDLSGDVHVGGVVLTLRDVSDRKVLEGELRHRAFHDSLTGLANRVLFTDRVGHALTRRLRAGTDVAVLLIDVDDFKFVNDTLGHAAGDELLVQVADRIVACLRDGDTAARLGGDEFAVCLESEPAALNISAVAQRILEATRASYRVSGSDVSIRVSIGISVAGRHTDAAAEMLREADLALYAAKNAGKDAYHFFEASLHRAAVDRLERRAALEEAIGHGGLRLHYQPITRLSDGEMVGMEALVRWQHPTLGLLPPSEFVPLAEECGLIVALGRWVLDQACADLARWQRRFTPGDGRPLHMAVNVSPRQLGSDDFLDVVDAALARHRVDPASLTLEITEGLLMQDSLDVMARLDALRARGIVLALDDFGTGYSSLSYLHRFPIQVLKIDRSFVNGMDEDPERRSILTAIVALASSLGLSLVAEGIEVASQAQRLSELNCGYGQGFHLGRPVPARTMDAVIAAAASAGAAGARPR